MADADSTTTDVPNADIDIASMENDPIEVPKADLNLVAKDSTMEEVPKEKEPKPELDSNLEPENIGQVKEAPKIDDADKVLHCDKCDFRTAHRSSLRGHTSRFHAVKFFTPPVTKKKAKKRVGKKRKVSEDAPSKTQDTEDDKKEQRECDEKKSVDETKGDEIDFR